MMMIFERINWWANEIKYMCGLFINQTILALFFWWMQCVTKILKNLKGQVSNKLKYRVKGLTQVTSQDCPGDTTKKSPKRSLATVAGGKYIRTLCCNSLFCSLNFGFRHRRCIPQKNGAIISLPMAYVVISSNQKSVKIESWEGFWLCHVSQNSKFVHILLN